MEVIDLGNEDWFKKWIKYQRDMEHAMMGTMPIPRDPITGRFIKHKK